MTQATRVVLPVSSDTVAQPAAQDSIPLPMPAAQPEAAVDRQLIPSPTMGIAAGAAIALTAGIATQTVNLAPEYEDQFQIKLESIAVDRPALTQVNPAIANLAPPEQILDSQIRFLQSPRFIDPIVQQLQAQDPQLDYAALVENLKITLTQPNTVEVRYRDTDAQRVQQVLQKLAQAYVQYGQECQDGNCRGVQFIQSKMPQLRLRITALKAEMQQFYGQHGLKDLDYQRQLFATRSTELGKQNAEIESKLAETVEKFNALQAQLGLKRDEAIALTLLKQDAQYQTQLRQIQTIDRQIADQLSRLQISSSALPKLYSQHQALQTQLHQKAQHVLTRYLAQANADRSNPFRQPTQIALLQQSVNTASYLQILQTRQQSLSQANGNVQQQQTQLISLLRQYDGLQQKLSSATTILQQYGDRLAALQQQQPTHTAWKLASLSSSTNAEDSANAENTVALAPQPLPVNLGAGAGVGAMLGLGIAVMAGAMAQSSAREEAQPPSIALAAD